MAGVEREDLDWLEATMENSLRDLLADPRPIPWVPTARNSGATLIRHGHLTIGISNDVLREGDHITFLSPPTPNSVRVRISNKVTNEQFELAYYQRPSRGYARHVRRVKSERRRRAK